MDKTDPTTGVPLFSSATRKALARGYGVPDDSSLALTKGVGEGTGLGLDTAQRIVNKHRGNIEVSSTPGDTRFKVFLPVAAAQSS